MQQRRPCGSAAQAVARIASRIPWSSKRAAQFVRSHSGRSARTGSRRLARTAGIVVAANVTAATRAPALMSTSGSPTLAARSHVRSTSRAGPMLSCVEPTREARTAGVEGPTGRTGPERGDRCDRRNWPSWCVGVEGIRPLCCRGPVRRDQKTTRPAADSNRPNPSGP